jgi:hypothetical protein
VIALAEGGLIAARGAIPVEPSSRSKCWFTWSIVKILSVLPEPPFPPSRSPRQAAAPASARQARTSAAAFSKRGPAPPSSRKTLRRQDTQRFPHSCQQS